MACEAVDYDAKPFILFHERGKTKKKSSIRTVVPGFSPHGNSIEYLLEFQLKDDGKIYFITKDASYYNQQELELAISTSSSDGLSVTFDTVTQLNHQEFLCTGPVTKFLRSIRRITN